MEIVKDDDTVTRVTFNKLLDQLRNSNSVKLSTVENVYLS